MKKQTGRRIASRPHLNNNGPSTFSEKEKEEIEAEVRDIESGSAESLSIEDVMLESLKRNSGVRA